MPHSADLVGRPVTLSADIPGEFGASLGAHHKLIGGWVAAREVDARQYALAEARAQIERVFEKAALDVLRPLTIADLRVVVLQGDDKLPPAIALICDSIGQIDLGWIEQSNVLSAEPGTFVAPVRWCAAAYQALCAALPHALPIFGYDEFFEDLSIMRWEGETDDKSAAACMMEWHGADPDEITNDMLPSAIIARRPEWMLAENAAPLKRLPASLAVTLRRLRHAVEALTASSNAWCYGADILDYCDDYEDRSPLPPMTLVPADHFGAELDEIAQAGSDYGFTDIAGLCPLSCAGDVDRWFASLRRGAELLLAAQDLIDTDPASS